MHRHIVRQSLVLLTIASISFNAYAAGLEYPWQSTSAMGSAQANAAEANDASTVFFNPAGMARLKTTMISQAGQVLSVRGQFENAGTTRQTNGAGTEYQTGGDGGSYHPQAIPAGQFYAVMPYSDTITLGLGIFVPYGANVNYKSDWVGRMFQDEGTIETVNINPSMSIRFDDKHSIGFGLSAQIMHMKLRAGADVEEAAYGISKSTIQTGASLACSPSGLPLIGGITAATCTGVANLLAGPLVSEAQGEGSLTIEGFGYGFGWNAGYMYRFNDDRTRFGLTYRSLIRQTIKADYDWDFSDVSGTIPDITGVREGNLLSLVGALTNRIELRDYVENYVRPDSKAELKIVTPESIGTALFHQVNERLALMGSLTWTRTSRIQELRVVAEDREGPNGTITQGDAVVNTRFRDTFKGAVGLNYRVNDKLMLRTGFGYEQTPLPDAEARHAALPDNNRFVYSLGANISPRKGLDIDLAYSYIVIEDAAANYTDDCHPSGYLLSQAPADGATSTTQCTGNGGTFRGVFKNTYVHSAGIQMNQRF